MNQAELEAFAENFFQDQRDILGMKGPCYSGATDGKGDRLRNFKRVAEQMGVSPIQTWLCYFLKHVDSVATYARTGLESEPIRGRFLDIANYAMLAAALVEEGK